MRFVSKVHIRFVLIWSTFLQCLYTLGNDDAGPKDGVTSVAISPDGRLVAAV